MARKSKLKMSDVAKMAEVSPATVSRVLSNPSVVKKKTRDRVLKIIEEVNYKPHIIARQFRMQQTKTILVVVPDITSAFFSEVLRGIEHEAIDGDYQVILGDTEHSLEREENYTNLLLQEQVDGMILLTAKLDKEVLEELAEHFPIVLACEYIDGLNVPTVSIDNISSAREATEHLIKAGHTKIAHISGPVNVILSRDRMQGYKQALLTHNLKMDPYYIHEGALSVDSGYNQMKKLLAMEIPPTAVFIYNDEMAFGAIKAVKDSGKRVPEDVAVVGFDNLKMGEVIEPHLTSVDQPKYDIGRKAMELLLKLINNETVSEKTHVLKNDLVVRDSCGIKLLKEKRYE